MKVNNKLILQIITKALNIPSKSIDEKTNLNTLEEWDSLGMLTVMSAVDKKFKGKMKIDSFEKVKNVSEIVKEISKK
jgi:Acyl carrier protein